jgi:hypothetical protein
MILAGAIEFGPAEIALILVALIAIFVVPLAVGALVGLLLYRRRVPPVSRTAGGRWLWGALGAAAGFALMLLVGAITELA